jgi:hypothetical protein
LQKGGRAVSGPLDLEKSDESTGFGEKDLQELQDRAAQGCAVRDLQREEAQAAAGLTARSWRSENASCAFAGTLI